MGSNYFCSVLVLFSARKVVGIKCHGYVTYVIKLFVSKDHVIIFIFYFYFKTAKSRKDRCDYTLRFLSQNLCYRCDYTLCFWSQNPCYFTHMLCMWHLIFCWFLCVSFLFYNCLLHIVWSWMMPNFSLLLSSFFQLHGQNKTLWGRNWKSSGMHLRHEHFAFSESATAYPWSVCGQAEQLFCGVEISITVTGIWD